MKPISLQVAVFVLPACLACLVEARGDLAQPEPAPKGRKFIDQGANDPRLKGYQTPEGVKLEIVAEAPVVVNPVGLTFGDDGTPYVLEWRPSPNDEGCEAPETFTYKDGTKRTIPTIKKKTKDVVKVLNDTQGEGVYDGSKVILEDELPSSILLHDGWIYLSGRGTVRRFKPKEPGGEYSVKEVVAQGFGGIGHRQVSGLTIGNDGWLYITCGAGDHYVEGSDGSRATVLRTGAVFRCRPDGSRMRTFALGFCNPYRDVAFDAYANMFHADNDAGQGDKSGGCRLLHVAEDADFGWRLRQGSQGHGLDPFRGAVAGESPGKMRSMRDTGRGAAAGLFVYNDSRFPEDYRGRLLFPDVVRQRIQMYKVEPRGATFAVSEEFSFLKSDDPLFRPCQVVLGPDGAIYVVDWRTDSTGDRRLWGDGVHGRIYRLSWTGTAEQPALPLRPRDSWAKIIALADADLLKALTHEEASDRTKARRELVRRGDKNRAALLKLLKDDEQATTTRVGVLGALNSFWDDDVQKAFYDVLADGEEPLRRLAADGLSLNATKGDKIAQECLLKAMSDNDPSVRRAVAVAMGRLAAAGAADALVNALAFDDGEDRYLRDGILRGIERLGEPGINRLLALAESGVKKETNRVADAFAALRTRAAYAGLPSLLKYPHLSVEQRVNLIRSCGNYLLDPPISLEPILAYVAGPAGQSAEVKKAAAELLAAGGTVRTARTDAWLLGLLAEEDSGLRLAGIKAIAELRVQQAKPRLIELAADKTRPAAEREAATSALRAIEGADAPKLRK